MRKSSRRKSFDAKRTIIEFIRANPGADGNSVVAGVGGTVDSVKHMLVNLAKAGYIRSEKEPITSHGGVRNTWWFVREYDVAEPPEPRVVKRANNRNSGIPLIFRMHQPKIPDVPDGAYRFRNDPSERMSMSGHGGQGAVRRSAWSRNCGVEYGDGS